MQGPLFRALCLVSAFIAARAVSAHNRESRRHSLSPWRSRRSTQSVHQLECEKHAALSSDKTVAQRSVRVTSVSVFRAIDGTLKSAFARMLAG